MHFVWNSFIYWNLQSVSIAEACVCVPIHPGNIDQGGLWRKLKHRSSSKVTHVVSSHVPSSKCVLPQMIYLVAFSDALMAQLDTICHCMRTTRGHFPKSSIAPITCFIVWFLFFVIRSEFLDNLTISSRRELLTLNIMVAWKLLFIHQNSRYMSIRHAFSGDS